MNDIRAITLDLDDTLWETGPVIIRAERELRAWFDRNYPRITAQFSLEAAYALRKAVMDEYADRAHDLTFLRCEVIRRMAVAADYDDLDVDEAFAVFDRYRNDLELFPDVRPALRSIKQRFTVIAVTNGNANLEKIGIAELFDGYVSARSAGAAKPARPIFDAAVTAGGAEPSRTLHVGDHPEYDVDGARDAGLRTAWVNRSGAVWPEALPRPDSTVTDLFELERLLANAG